MAGLLEPLQARITAVRPCRGAAVAFVAPVSLIGSRCRRQCAQYSAWTRSARGRPLQALPAENDDSVLGSGVCPVPEEQQPLQELKSLQNMMLFAWATRPWPEFIARLGCVWGVFLVTLGLPVSAVTFDLRTQGVECFVAASIGSLFIVMVTVSRLYLGWAHVGNRLLSATVEYEETGWYDGQIWVKTPEVLMRDRLLGTYTVKPTLARLQTTMVSLAGIMATSAVLLAALPAPDAKSVVPREGLGLPGASAPVDGRMEAQWAKGRVEGADYWKSVECFEPWALDESKADGTDAGEVQRGLGMHGRREGCK